MTTKCDGDCGEMSTRRECEPPVERVRIVRGPHGKRFAGMEFDYCQTAMRLDRENGFHLERVAATESD